MTRKDFVLIANVMKAHIVPNNRDMTYMHERLSDAFATALSHTNPRFDRARFLAACGVQS